MSEIKDFVDGVFLSDSDTTNALVIGEYHGSSASFDFLLNHVFTSQDLDAVFLELPYHWNAVFSAHREETIGDEELKIFLLRTTDEFYHPRIPRLVETINILENEEIPLFVFDARQGSVFSDDEISNLLGEEHQLAYTFLNEQISQYPDSVSYGSYAIESLEAV